MAALAAVLWAGEIAPRDPQRAMGLWGKAADLGDPDARFAYAERILESPPDRPSVDRAISYLKELAEAGYQGASEMLGEC
ncbi:MAG: hypothetical protein LBT40_02335 [Deltaproteobacteria bacterium]|nr:hypothetical protein [Deltaproteobacteria bacterium]